ncbi:acetyltransferase GNAT family (plasmid) [Butyrivibrio proteoclasticus B316]|uniref:Acetyltransferase GNAT family n=1 Tax=Butyrivibrio proteoclasticus (strain ATCC 51982 / DSM 14932 / B316) TaxID=515622 RepID=E0S560_BUTPB|nr:GNAT family N-acetyltransferase [Butyrivibrio proteoclasticus]ADL36542.1 acetyltransferase GNAT family [Butyrivibrio proteoclasticus B316]
MKLSVLNIAKIKEIYETRMVIDFPKAELKPMKYIIEAVNVGIYECLGLYENEYCIGYTFLVKQGNSYLIDYIAIYPDKRNKGAGSTLLRLLNEYLADADIVIVEVEDSKYANSDEEKDLQTRRLGFYLRNGCIDTGLRVRCFGVPFIILSLGKDNGGEPDTLWDIYNAYYKAVLPKEMYEKNIERIG